MDTQDSTKTNDDHVSELSERGARIETEMDFGATHKDLAAVRTEIEDPRTEFACSQGELLNQMPQMNAAMVAEDAGIATLVANREASMQRWLLGFTGAMLAALWFAVGAPLAKAVIGAGQTAVVWHGIRTLIALGQAGAREHGQPHEEVMRNHERTMTA